MLKLKFIVNSQNFYWIDKGVNKNKEEKKKFILNNL